MANSEKIKPDVELEPIENSSKKRSKFDKFVDKYFAPNSKTDFLDIFSIINLLVYGMLKLVSKTRIKYKKWRKRENASKMVQRKIARIKDSRDKNLEEAKSLDDLNPEIKEQARQMAKDMIEEKSPVAKDKSEEELELEIGKNLQYNANRANEQNPWVDKWKLDVEAEIRGKVLNGKHPANSQQFTDDFIKEVNSRLWLQERTNARANTYVQEMIMEDPSLKGEESRLKKEIFSQAYEQALIDRQLIIDLKKWQDELRTNLLNESKKEPDANDKPAENENLEVDDYFDFGDEFEQDENPEKNEEAVKENPVEKEELIKENPVNENVKEETFETAAENMQAEPVEAAAENVQAEPVEAAADNVQEEPVEAAADNVQEERVETTAENVQAEPRESIADSIQEEHKEDASKNEQAKPQVPIAKNTQMPRWWNGAVLDRFLADELKPPTSGEAESNERREFRESVEKLARATKDPARNNDMLINEYVDVYEKAKKFNEYLNAHPESPEQEKGKEVSQNIVNWLEYSNRIENYKELKKHDLNKMNKIALDIVGRGKEPERNKKIERNKKPERDKRVEKEYKEMPTRKRRNAIYKSHKKSNQEVSEIGVL